MYYLSVGELMLGVCDVSLSTYALISSLFLSLLPVEFSHAPLSASMKLITCLS